MHKVFFSEVALGILQAYGEAYFLYYKATFTDTGIWSEDLIVDGYYRESEERKIDIQSKIISRLSQEKVLGRSTENVVAFQWRSKYIRVVWEDLEEEIRIVQNIEFI